MAQNNVTIQLNDSSQLEHEVKQFLVIFEQKESEETWESHENAIIRLTSIVRGSNHLPNLTQALRKLKTGIQNAIATDRTRLCRTSMLLVEEMGRSIGPRFDSLVDLFVPSVLKIATRANKVFVSSASQCLIVLVEHTGSVAMIPILSEALKNQSKTLRIAAIETILRFMETQNVERYEHLVEIIENIIRNGVVDSTSTVRENCRKVFEIYEKVFSHRVDSFSTTLNDTMRKYLKVSYPAQNQPNKLLRKKSQKLTVSDSSLAIRNTQLNQINRVNSEKISLENDKSRTQIQRYLESSEPTPNWQTDPANDTPNNNITERQQSRSRRTSSAKNESMMGISMNSGWLSSSTLPTAQSTSGILSQKASRIQAGSSEQFVAPQRVQTANTENHAFGQSVGDISAGVFQAISKVIKPRNSVDQIGTTAHSHLLEFGGAQRVRANSITDSQGSVNSSGMSIRKPLRVPVINVEKDSQSNGASGKTSQLQIEHPRASAISPGRDNLDPSTISYERRKVEKKRRQTTVGISSDNGLIPKSLLEHSAALGLRQNSVSSEPQLLELSEIAKMVKSNDWPERVKGFEALGEYVSMTPHDIRTRLTKITEFFGRGLLDSHFKVIQTVASALQESIPRIGQYYNHVDQISGQSFLDHVVPLLAAVVFQPSTMRTKQNLFDVGIKTVEMVRLQFKGEPLLNSLVSSFNNPEWAQIIRVKQGVIMFLSELQIDEWVSYLAKIQNIKIIMTRFAAVAGDKLDIVTVKNLRAVISTLHMTNVEDFWVVWPQLKLSEKSNINKLFDTPDIFTNTGVLFQTQKAKVSPSRSISRSRPGSPTTSDRRGSSPSRVEKITSLSQRSVSPAMRAIKSPVLRAQTLASPQISRSPLARNAPHSSPKPSPLTSPRSPTLPARRLSMSSTSSANSGSAKFNHPNAQFYSNASDTSTRSNPHSLAQIRTPPRIPPSLTLLPDPIQDEINQSNIHIQIPATRGTVAERLASAQSEVQENLITSYRPQIVDSRAQSRSFSETTTAMSDDGVSERETAAQPPEFYRRSSSVTNSAKSESTSGTGGPLIELEEEFFRGRTLQRQATMRSQTVTVKTNNPPLMELSSMVTPSEFKLMEFADAKDDDLQDETFPSGFDDDVVASSATSLKESQIPDPLINELPNPVESQFTMQSRLSESPDESLTPKISHETVVQAFEVETVKDQVSPLATFNKITPQRRQIYSWDMRVLDVDSQKIKDILQSNETISAMGTDDAFLNLVAPAAEVSQPKQEVIIPKALEETESPVKSPASVLDQTEIKEVPYEFFEDVVTTEDVALAVATSVSPAKTLERILDVARRRRTSLWGNKTADLVSAVVDGLREIDENKVRSTKSVQKSLVLLRELLVNQTSSIPQHAASILLAILQPQNFSGTAEDILEIAYEIDAVLEAFVQYLPAQIVRDAVLETLSADFGHRVCFEMLSQIAPCGNLDDAFTPTIVKDVEKTSLPWHLAKGLESTKAATRKAAFECLMAMSRRLGRERIEIVLQIVHQESGEARGSLIRNMIERQMPTI
ncbi:hypothetical protein HK096_003621 [Nowakowskiella sp. JEL0078]|nr:hypothetical protein HK096_003621 [Nowakowskiella sp. JEL0078]